MDGDGDLPLALAQRLLQALDDPQVAYRGPVRPHCSRERLLQPLEVAGRIVHVGLGHLDIVEPDHRIELDVAHLGALAHDLACGPGCPGGTSMTTSP